MTDILPSVLKTTKVVVVLKKDSKPDYINYRLISLLSNVHEILENVCIKAFISFSITTILSVTYS